MLVFAEFCYRLLFAAMGRSKLMADGIKAYQAEGTRVLGYCKSVDSDVAAERKQNWEEEERYRKREEEEAERKK